MSLGWAIRASREKRQDMLQGGAQEKRLGAFTVSCSSLLWCPSDT